MKYNLLLVLSLIPNITIAAPASTITTAKTTAVITKNTNNKNDKGNFGCKTHTCKLLAGSNSIKSSSTTKSTNAATSTDKAASNARISTTQDINALIEQYKPSLKLALRMGVSFINDFERLRYLTNVPVTESEKIRLSSPTTINIINSSITQSGTAFDIKHEAPIANDPRKFVEPFVNFKLGGKINGDYVRGAVTLEINTDHNQEDRVKNQFMPAIKVYEAYATLGPKDGWNVEFGICDSPATTVFVSDKQFYRGFDKGIFGKATKYFRQNNKITSGSEYKLISLEPSKNNTNPSLEQVADTHDATYPITAFFFSSQIMGDSSGRPRINLYTPVYNIGSHSIRAAIGADVTSNADHGIFVTAGTYYNYSFDQASKLQLSLAGGLSTKPESELFYQRYMGVSAAIAYLSKAIDIELKATYNHKSGVMNNRLVKTHPVIFSKTKEEMTAALQPHIAIVNGYVIPDITLANLQKAYPGVWTFDKDKATAPLVFSLKSRINVGNDKDITLAGLYSRRNSGMIDSKGSNKIEHIMGGSVGFNMPLSKIPFRAGIEVSYVHMIHDGAREEYKANDMHLPYLSIGKKLLSVSVGCNYAPIEDHPDDQHKPVVSLTQSAIERNIV